MYLEGIIIFQYLRNKKEGSQKIRYHHKQVKNSTGKLRIIKRLQNIIQSFNYAEAADPIPTGIMRWRTNKSFHQSLKKTLNNPPQYSNIAPVALHNCTNKSSGPLKALIKTTP